MSGKAVNSLGFVLCENRSGGKVTLSEHEVQMEFTETRRGGDLNRLVNELTIEEKACWSREGGISGTRWQSPD